MAAYKVIQDIEAEDKLVGPFSLRQFIYAGIAALCGYLSVISVTKGAVFLLIVFLPPMLFCMFFAWPWSPDQPTEVWALAKIRFYLKPRRRIWDQSGIKELVTITVPKKIEKTYTNGLTQTEVTSRLRALADTIDSRGWVIKNSNVSLTTPSYVAQATGAADTDRLISYDSIPQAVPETDISAVDDIFDTQNSPIAQQFDQMMQNSAQAHRQQIVNQLSNDMPAPVAPQNSTQNTNQPPNDYWFMHQTPTPQHGRGDGVMFSDPQVVQPGVSAQSGHASEDEAVLAEALKHQTSAQASSTSHLKTIDPAGSKPQPAPDAITQDLARNNDLNVATLAREAQKAREPKLPPDDEVVIPLR